MSQIGNIIENAAAASISAGFVYASGPFTADASGNITSFEFKRLGAGGNMYLGIYADSGGSPGSKVGDSQQIVGAVSGWNSVAPSGTIPIVSGNSYWLAARVQSSTGAATGVSRNSSASGKSLRFFGGQTYGATMPSTFAGGASTLGSFVDPLVVNYSATGLASGTLSLASRGDGVATVETATASGGTPPYAYQFHRGLSPDFNPDGTTSLAAVSTETVFADSDLTNGLLYFYKVVATDSVADSVTSDTFPVVPAVSKNWLLIGDSFGKHVWDGVSATELNDFAMGNQLAAMMTASEPANAVSHAVSNQAVSGASAATWVSTHLATAIAAAPAATYPNVIIMLGLNDANSSATASAYKSSMQTIITTLRANGYGDIVLCYAPMVYWGSLNTAAEQSRLIQYAEKIDELEAENNDISVVNTLLSYAPNNLSDFGFSDNDIHPVEAGGPHLATAIAAAIVRASGNGGGVSTFNPFRSRAFGA